LRDRAKEYEKRNVQVVVVFSHEPSYVRYVLRFRGFDPKHLPFTILADPAATVSATYGVAFQAHEAGWSNREAGYVIDRAGIVRFVDNNAVTAQGGGTHRQALDDLAEERRLIEGLKAKDAALQQAAAAALGPVGPVTRLAVPG
jgi:peroxiredoxin